MNLRTGPLPTISHLFEYLRHLNRLDLDHRFGLIIDDKVFEDQQPDVECSALDLAVGLGCDYFYVKGCTKPERIAKLYAYSQIVKGGLQL